MRLRCRFGFHRYKTVALNPSLKYTPVYQCSECNKFRSWIDAEIVELSTMLTRMDKIAEDLGLAPTQEIKQIIL